MGWRGDRTQGGVNVWLVMARLEARAHNGVALVCGLRGDMSNQTLHHLELCRAHLLVLVSLAGQVEHH